MITFNYSNIKKAFILFVALAFVFVCILTFQVPHNIENNNHLSKLSAVDNHTVVGLIPHGKLKVFKVFVSYLILLCIYCLIVYFKIPQYLIMVWFHILLLKKILLLRPLKFTSHYVG